MMLVWIRRLAPLAVVAVVAMTAIVASAKPSPGGPLTGTWSGYIAGPSAKRQHIRVVVNAKQTGGSWKISRACYGPLTLESISGGYHHYLRRVARGASCARGDIDCLKRVGADVYDAVTSHRGDEYDSGGTLRRVNS